jgi:hypothetical protein
MKVPSVGWKVRAGACAARMASSGCKNIYYDNMVQRLDTIKYLIVLHSIDQIIVGTDHPTIRGTGTRQRKSSSSLFRTRISC